MRRELRSMLKLALPVIAAELGWITMGIVDTIIVGPLGPAAIGAVGSGSTMFLAVMVLGMGTLLALDTFVAQSYGAGRLDDCHRWLFAGLQLAAVMSVVLVIAGAIGLALLPYAGMHPEVTALLVPYLSALLWSAPPLLLFTVFRRYLQAMNVVKPVTVALVSANVINAAANWVLIYGQLGMPALGVRGSAYATVIARIYMALFLLAVIVLRERRQPSSLSTTRFAIDPARMWALLRVGVPAAMQVTLEVGVFAAVSVLAARITPLSVAANQIVLNIAGFFFMIPYGLSTAAAVRVGHAVGRQDPLGVRLSGGAALGLALVVTVAVSVVFVIAPLPFLRIFTEDVSVLQAGSTVLLIYAICQPFDGVQTVATGALRGLGETRLPMLVNLGGHWIVGLPLAYVLCFRRGWGVEGLWAGLTVGLMLIGSVLFVVWRKRSHRFEGTFR
ncbi:MAG TPA: MATE family efflux transporter [Vicinamibacterales bacterium]|nr:MATE family efflux transporter [Vicinamibacterales bacterium]